MQHSVVTPLTCQHAEVLQNTSTTLQLEKDAEGCSWLYPERWSRVQMLDPWTAGRDPCRDYKPKDQLVLLRAPMSGQCPGGLVSTGIHYKSRSKSVAARHSV